MASGPDLTAALSRSSDNPSSEGLELEQRAWAKLEAAGIDVGAAATCDAQLVAAGLGPRPRAKIYEWRARLPPCPEQSQP